MGNDTTGDLPFAHDNHISSQILQVLDFRVGVRPCDDTNDRICGTRLDDDLPGLKRIGNG